MWPVSGGDAFARAGLPTNGRRFAMNTLAVTGTVISAPEGEQHERSGERVWHFRLAIDTRKGRATEAEIFCWRELGRFTARYLVVGDRVVVTGCLSHNAGRGLIIAASQLARLSEEVAAQPSDEAAQWARAATGVKPLEGAE
jgi:hypothetical protein